MAKRQLISEQDVVAASRKPGKELQISPNAIITPLAQDAAQVHGVSFEVIEETAASLLSESAHTIVIASGKHQIRIKKKLAAFLQPKGWTVIDLNAEQKHDDILQLTVETAKAIVTKRAVFGIILDTDGIQPAMVLNRFAGIRAMQGFDSEAVRKGRSQYDINAITLGIESLSQQRILSLTDIFVSTKFKNLQQ